MFRAFLVLFALFVLAFAGPTDYFTAQDNKQIETLILSKYDKTTGAFNKNLKDTFFAVDALKKLNVNVQSISAAVCKYAKEALVADKIETIFQSVSVTEALDCGSQASENVVNEITSALSDNKLYDLVYAVGAISVLKTTNHIKIESSEILPAVTSIINLMDTEYGTWFLEEDQEEGSAYFAGLALTAISQLVPQLDNLDELSEVFDAIPALLSHERGDDNDESRLFFRHPDNSINSLKTTAFLVKGLADFVKATDHDNIASNEDVNLIASFLISQKYVSSIEDAHSLVVGLTAVNSGAFKRPLVISLKNTQIHATKEKDRDTDIKVVVTDIWGKHAGVNRVFLVKAYQSGKEEMALLSNQEVPLAEGEKNVYSLDFLAARPDPGAFVLEFRVIPQEKPDEFSFLPISSAFRRIQVVAAVGLSDGSISVSERDSRGKDTPFEQGKTIQTEFDLKGHQHVYISFKLRNVVSGRSVLAHQAFIKITHKSSKETVYYVVPNLSQAYELHLSIAKLAPKFNFASGSYEIELMVGDSFISGSFRWVLAKANITFDGKPLPVPEVKDPFTPRPIIEHKFRPSASLAPEYMTNIFFVLVLVPLAFLIIGIFRVGGNFSNYPRTGLVPLYALLFVASFGSLLVLIIAYWYWMKLFVALGYGLSIGIPTIFFGNQVLFYYAQQRESTKKQKTH